MRYLKNTVVPISVKSTIPILLIGLFQNLCNAQNGRLDLNVLEHYVDSYITNYLEPGLHTSATLTIVKEDEFVFSRGYGMANYEDNAEVTPKSIFRIGSVSKPFTCMAILQLVDKGLLDLHADVNTYLKDFKIPKTFSEPITIHSILTHTTGFEESFFGHLFTSNENEIIPLKEALKKYMPARVNPPGKHPSYSNYAVCLLGLIIEEVSGEPFEQYMRKHVFTPLGMENSTFEQPLPDNLVSKYAYSYRNERDTLVPREFTLATNYTPAGGMSSTADDMARFIQFHLHSLDSIIPGSVLKRESLDKMHHHQFRTSDALPGINYGFMQEQADGYFIFGHSGQTPYYIADLVIDPKNKLGLFISSTGNNAHDLVSNFAPELLGKFFPNNNNKDFSPSTIIHSSDPQFDAKKYEGQYFSWWGNFSQIEKLNHLIEGVEITSSRNNTLLLSGLSFQDSIDEYVNVGKHLFRERDGSGLISFEEDTAGDVTVMYDSFDPTQTYSKGNFYFFGSFNFPAVAICFVLFVAAILFQAYVKIRNIKETAPFRWVRTIAALNASVNVSFAIGGALFWYYYGVELMYGIPWFFFLLLILPLISCLLGIVQLVLTYFVWNTNYWTIQSKVFYSLNSLAGIFMIWFFYFWNVLGFKFYSP